MPVRRLLKRLQNAPRPFSTPTYWELGQTSSTAVKDPRCGHSQGSWAIVQLTAVRLWQEKRRLERCNKMQLKYYFILQNHVIFHVIFVSQTMFISWQAPKASNTENACRIALVQLVAHRSSAGGRDGLVIW